MKVTFCAYDHPRGRIGGPIGWALDFIPFLTNAFSEVRVLVLVAGGHKVSRIAAACEEQKIPVEVLDTGERVSLDDEVEWILDQCRVHAPDVVIANLVLPALYAARYLKSSGIRSIGVIHSDPRHDDFYADFTQAFVHDDHSLDDVVCVSEHIRESVQADGVPADGDLQSFPVIPCGCRLPSNLAAWNHEPLKLIYVGRLEEQQKRIRETTQALLAACELPHVTATICGSGSEADWVRETLAGQDRVQFRGQLSPADLQEEILRHQVLVLLSDFEGLPIALVEGMAAGLVPVGLAAAPGVSEVIDSERNGLLVSDRSAAFVDAIARLKDERLWTRMSGEARRTVEDTYSHAVAFRQWEELLESAGPSRVDVGRIPRHVRLPVRNGIFKDYPPNRPTPAKRFKTWVQGNVLALRLFLRPRARLRALMKSVQKRPHE